MSCIVSSSYVIVDDKPEIILCLRDKDYKRSKLNIPYNPYFYVRESEYNRFLSLIPIDISDELRETQTGFYGVDGCKLIRIFTSLPSVIGEINSHIRDYNNRIIKSRETEDPIEEPLFDLYESNILFHYRYLIDNKLVTGIDPETMFPVKVKSYHKRIFIDIETLMKESKPSASRDKIIVIGIYDYHTKKYHLLYIGNRFKVSNDVIKSDVKTVVMHPCRDEFDLISKFASLWANISPDIVCSFSKFDMNFIVRRLQYLHINPDFLSPIFQVRATRDISIKCLHIVDYEQLYRTVYGEPVWNTLEYVATKELGYGKLDLDEDIPTLWSKDYRKVVEYNLRDVELLRDLEDELSLIDNYVLFIWSQTGLDLEDCFMTNRIGDMCHFRYLAGKYIFRTDSPVEYSKYEGALNDAFRKGLSYRVGVFDWNELYPSIMEIFHISMDTLDPYGDIIIKGNISATCKEVRFSSYSPGWTNQIMIPFRRKRQREKAKAKEATINKIRRALKVLSQALKVINNAQYGLYGQCTDKFKSRFYDHRIAGAITFIGREVSEKAKEIIESLGYELIYRDSDSFFIPLKRADEEEIKFLRTTIQSEVNAFLKSKYKITKELRLDFEYIATRIFVLTKKKYQGIKENGEFVVKGINIIQKNTSKYTVLIGSRVGEMRLKGISVTETKEYIDKVYNNVRHGRIPLDMIAPLGRCNQKTYKKINRNLKAMTYSASIGIEIPLGSRFKWLYVHPKGATVDVPLLNDKKKIIYQTVDADVIAFMDIEQIPRDIVIDYKKMADTIIKKPLKRYIEEEKHIRQQPLSKYW